MKQVIPKHAEEPTWQDQVDRDIEDTETRLRDRSYEYDRTLEVLIGNRQPTF